MKSIVFFKYVLTILFALNVTCVRADFTAKVQRVVDGDTIYVEGYNEPFRVTVYENDTIKYLPFV